MSTSFIITGQMRTFDRCLPNMAWMVFRHFEQPFRFFVSTVRDKDSHKANLLRARFPDSEIEIDVVEEQPSFPELDSKWKGPGQIHSHEPYAISVPPSSIMRQLWQLQRGWRLREKTKSKDTVVRCRPDLWFLSFEPLPLIPSVRDCFTPWWGAFGGVNDRFAVMSELAAHFYFTTFDRSADLIEQRGCPLHPESLIRASMECAGILIHQTLDTEFSTMGIVERPPEIMAADIARYAHHRRK